VIVSCYLRAEVSVEGRGHFCQVNNTENYY